MGRVIVWQACDEIFGGRKPEEVLFDLCSNFLTREEIVQLSNAIRDWHEQQTTQYIRRAMARHAAKEKQG